MKKLRGVFIFLTILLVASVTLIVTGYSYVFTALYHNFPNIDDYEIFYNNTIEKSSNPQPWAVSDDYNKTQLSKDFKSQLKKLNTVALLVIKDDSIQYEEYWDGYSHESFSNSFSIAKTYVSVLTGIALKEGKIKSLDQPVAHFIPEFKNDERRNIKIRHLLTMSSGLNWKESYSNPFSVTTRGYYGTDLRETVLNLKVEEEPGKKFEYRSGDTQILGIVLEKATGMTLSEYLEKKIWQPTGSKENALWSLDRQDGMEKAYCCLNTNARDYARLGQLYLNYGNWKGQQLVDSSYVKESVTPTGMTYKPTRKPVDFYGYSWWIIPNFKGEKVFYARGILGQYIFVIPSKNIVAVRLGKERGEVIGNHYSDVYQILEEVYDKF